MNALHLMVDTGNPNAIDLSLKNFGFKIAIDWTATRRRNIERSGNCLRRTLPACARQQ
jgi:hypothetical protein